MLQWFHYQFETEQKLEIWSVNMWSFYWDGLNSGVATKWGLIAQAKTVFAHHLNLKSKLTLAQKLPSTYNEY